MATVGSVPEQRFLLTGVPWLTYARLLRIFGDRPGVRLTYDRGMLELRTLSHKHENLVDLLVRFVYVLTEELGLPVKGGRSTTLRRRKCARGLEPDASWWIANEALVRGKPKIDLRSDPPPDLALEIDITHSSLDRLGIYATLRIPEVWRWERGALVCHVLGTDGTYQESAVSRAFPGIKPADLVPFLALLGKMDENGVVRQFRVWVRQRPAGGETLTPSP